jgi:hypothetical protein
MTVGDGCEVFMLGTEEINMEIKLACLSQSLQDHISDLIDKY